jgi:hypothetical protein
VAAASLAAEATALQKRNIAVAEARLEMWWQHSGGGGNNGELAVAAWRMLIIILIVIMTMIIDGGGGKGGRGGERAGCMHRWRLLQWTAMTIAMVIIWAKKGLNKEKGEKELKDGFVFFMLSDFVIVFWLIFFNQVNWFLPLLLCAAVTIMVKKRFVNSIPFFYFVGSGSTALAAWRQRWWWRQHSGGSQLGGGGGSLAEAQF